jgi:hypothetical protein
MALPNGPKSRTYWKRITIPWVGGPSNGNPAGMLVDPLLWRPIDVGGRVVFYNPAGGARGALELVVGAAPDASVEPGPVSTIATDPWLPPMQGGGVILRPGDSVAFPAAPGRCFVRPAPGECRVVQPGSFNSYPTAWADVGGSGVQLTLSRRGEPLLERAELLVADDIRFFPRGGVDINRLLVPALYGASLTEVSFFRAVAASGSVNFQPLGFLVPQGTLRRFPRHLLQIAVRQTTTTRSNTDQRVGTLTAADIFGIATETWAFGSTEANSYCASLWDVTQGGLAYNVDFGAPVSAYTASAASGATVAAWYVLDMGTPFAGAGLGARPIWGHGTIQSPAAIGAANERMTICLPATRTAQTVAYATSTNLAAATAVIGLLGAAPGIDGVGNLGVGFSTAGANVAYLTRGMSSQPTATLTNFTLSGTGAAMIEGVGTAGALLANTAVGQVFGRMEYTVRAV